MLQRYVSKELTHFLGRSLANDYKRYELLLKILEGGLLRGIGITDVEIQYESFKTKVTVYDNKTLDLEETPYVCFCDIPVDDLGIHMSKYSKFGLSFLKEFLIEKRINPVFYVAIDSKLSYNIITKAKLDYFNRELCDFLSLMSKMIDFRKEYNKIKCNDRSLPNFDGILDTFIKFYDFFTYEILHFLKHSECNKSDTDKENYYMEREWRVLGFVKFELKDVCRIILPKSYIKRFREDKPDYYGQIASADDYSLPE